MATTNDKSDRDYIDKDISIMENQMKKKEQDQINGNWDHIVVYRDKVEPTCCGVSCFWIWVRVPISM